MSDDLLGQYRALLAKVDAFWDRAVSTQPAGFRCASGCDDCCHQRLTVFPVEAAAIRAHLATVDRADRTRLARTADETDRCSFLVDGRCGIYEARPIICRTHGLPLRVEGKIDHCPLNFTDDEPEPAIILDLEQINTLLALVDRLHAEARADPVDRPRIPLSDLAKSKP